MANIFDTICQSCCSGGGGGSTVAFSDNGDGTGTLYINGQQFTVITEQYNDSELHSSVAFLESDNNVKDSEINSLEESVSELMTNRPIVIEGSDSEILESIELESDAD